jgi:hypothetical protein|tara:strand:- start:718 stop:888 length:171 start_codon:yes stop_codon:yes gene_type:complete
MSEGKFLPDNEQSFYDSVVDGLRRQGWSRIDAEDEALERLERHRANSATNSPPAKQ